MITKPFDRNRILSMAPLLGLTAMVSCGGTEPRDLGLDQIEVVEETRLIVGDLANLTLQELEDYKQDLAYVGELTAREKQRRGYLNLADARQHRFVMARLKISGKSPSNSPQLFRALDEVREGHVRLGYGTDLVPRTSFRNGDDGRQEQHFVSELEVGATQGVGVVNSTYTEPTVLSIIDAVAIDSSGSPIGAGSALEEYGGGTDMRLTASFDPDNSPTAQMGLSSMKMDFIEEDVVISYVSAMVGPEDAAMTTRLAPMTFELAVDAPEDVDGDGIIQVCLNRNWPVGAGGCNYNLTSTPQAIKLPLQGSVHITSPGDIFSAEQIALYQADADSYDTGHIKLVLTNSGGGCDVEDDGLLSSDMQHFWNNVELSADNKTLAWDLSGADSAFFDDGCRQVQDVVFLNTYLALPWLRTSELGAGVHFISVSVNSIDQDSGAQSTHVIQEPIKITNSCLAAGTLIQMADGSLRAIEDLASGDRVFNTFHDGAKGLTVMATAVGFEPIPMVRLESDRGHSSLMTEMHPVVTPDRGIVFARDLEEGDLVMTMGGVSVVTKAALEDYDGQVYNLKVGDELEQAALDGEDRTLVYADGFLVGDGQIQTKHEMDALKAHASEDVLTRLPVEWHQDFQSSPLRKHQ